MTVRAFPKGVQCWDSKDLFSTVLQSRAPQPAVEMDHAGCGERTYYRLFCRRREAKSDYCSRKHKRQHAGKWCKSHKHVLRKQCSSSNEQEYTEAEKLSSAHETWIEASVLIHGQVSARRNWISPDLQSRPWLCQGYSSATNWISLNSNKKRQAAILQTPGPIVPLWPANRAGISWAALEPTVLDHRRRGEMELTPRTETSCPRLVSCVHHLLRRTQGGKG